MTYDAAWHARIWREHSECSLGAMSRRGEEVVEVRPAPAVAPVVVPVAVCLVAQLVAQLVARVVARVFVPRRAVRNVDCGMFS